MSGKCSGASLSAQRRGGKVLLAQDLLGPTFELQAAFCQAGVSYEILAENDRHSYGNEHQPE